MMTISGLSFHEDWICKCGAAVLAEEMHQCANPGPLVQPTTTGPYDSFEVAELRKEIVRLRQQVQRLEVERAEGYGRAARYWGTLEAIKKQLEALKP